MSDLRWDIHIGDWVSFASQERAMDRETLEAAIAALESEMLYPSDIRLTAEGEIRQSAVRNCIIVLTRLREEPFGFFWLAEPPAPSGATAALVSDPFAEWLAKQIKGANEVKDNPSLDSDFRERYRVAVDILEMVQRNLPVSRLPADGLNSEKMSEWFERVNQKFSDTRDGSRPPSYEALWTDVQDGLLAVGHMLTLLDVPRTNTCLAESAEAALTALQQDRDALQERILNTLDYLELIDIRDLSIGALISKLQPSVSTGTGKKEQ